MKAPFAAANRPLIIVSTIVGLLCIPLIAMQFTEEVNWDLFDFIVGGALLLGAGMAIELVLRSVKTTRSRLMFCLIVIAALLLVWAELAVGIFGTPISGS